MESRTSTVAEPPAFAVNHTVPSVAPVLTLAPTTASLLLATKYGGVPPRTVNTVLAPAANVTPAEGAVVYNALPVKSVTLMLNLVPLASVICTVAEPALSFVIVRIVSITETETTAGLSVVAANGMLPPTNG